MKKTFLLSVVALFIAIPFQVHAQTEIVKDETKLYTIVVPSGWNHSGTKSKYISTLKCSETTGSSQILTFIASKNENSLLKAYEENKQSFSEFKAFEVLQEGDMDLDGEPCKWFTYTFTSKDGSVKMKGKYYTVMHSGNGFLILYTVTAEQFDLVQTAFDKIVATLKFK
jgi:hypothetical protein